MDVHEGGISMALHGSLYRFWVFPIFLSSLLVHSGDMKGFTHA
jgi:hypothetical protein